MKSLLCASAAVSIVLTAFAAKSMPIKRKGYEVTSSLKLEGGTQNVSLKSTMIFESGHKTWSTLIPSRDGVMLLGRLVKVEGGTAEIEYLVIDTKRKEAVVSSPKLVVVQGESAEMTVSTPQGRVAVQTLIRTIERN